MSDQMSTSRREHEDELQQDCKENVEMLNRRDNIMSSYPAQQKRNLETETHQRHEDKQRAYQTERGSQLNEQTGSEKQGREGQKNTETSIMASADLQLEQMLEVQEDTETSIMATADLQLEQMFSWMEQRELCAEQLRKLAKELESFREKHSVCKRLGSAAAVFGALCLIWAGVASYFISVAAAAVAVFGVTIIVVTKTIRRFLSSKTLKELQKTEENINKVSDKIQKLFQQLKAELKNRSPSADPDEVDQHIMTEILRAVGRRSGLKGEINVHIRDNKPQFYLGAGPRSTGLSQSSFNPAVVAGLAGVLTFFTFELSGTEFQLLFAEGAEQLKQVATAGLQTVLRGGAKAVGGALGLAFSLHEAVTKWTEMIKNNNVTEASQSLRDTADDLLKINRTLREQFDIIRQKLKTLDDVRRCIGNRRRRANQIQPLLNFAKEHSEDEAVKDWLTNTNSDTFIKLVDMFDFLKEELKEEKKNIDCSEDLHITFVAHGEIRNPLIPASYLVPLPSITDVLLFSPWNCFITSEAAYGVATGRIEPQHRIFCRPEDNDLIPDKRCRPTNLPDRWNSMRSAAQQMIPNIFVTTLKKPADGAWRQTLFLNDEHGQPRRNRIVFPFILPGAMDSSVTVPFSVITLVLSLVLAFSEYKATVHLVACLGRSAGTTLNKAELNAQYACTVDDTAMTASEDMFLDIDTELFRALKAVFG